MKTLIFTILFLSMFGLVYSSDLSQLQKQLSEIKYEMKIGDKLQTPKETMQLKTGDCEDFAVLTNYLLKQIGIKSEIVIIKFKRLNIEHAICI